MFIIILIILFAFVLFIVFIMNENSKDENISNNILKNIQKKYGNPTTSIVNGENLNNIYDQIIVYDSLKIIILKGKEYKYSEIIGFNILDGQQCTKTSTSNMVGRAVIGGIIGGGVGSLAGAATAKKNTNPEYKLLHITVKDMKDPDIVYMVYPTNFGFINSVQSILSIIISYNNKM